MKLSQPPAVAGWQFVIIGAMISTEEEMEDVAAYDEVKTSSDEAIPFAQAIKEIEDESNDNN